LIARKLLFYGVSLRTLLERSERGDRGRISKVITYSQVSNGLAIKKCKKEQNN
jgi:hypothetical protein